LAPTNMRNRRPRPVPRLIAPGRRLVLPPSTTGGNRAPPTTLLALDYLGWVLEHHAIVFADLPMRDTETVALIRATNADLDIDEGSVSPGDYL